MDEDLRDAEGMRQFVKWADSGYAPALIFDDDGKWAVVFDGIQSVPYSDEELQFLYTVPHADWHDTPQEAIAEAARQFPC